MRGGEIFTPYIIIYSYKHDFTHLINNNSSFKGWNFYYQLIYSCLIDLPDWH